jgi:hypothetical protein
MTNPSIVTTNDTAEDSQALPIASEVASDAGWLPQQVSLAKSLEMRAGFYQTLLNYMRQIAPSDINIEISRSFKAELASVLDGFVRVLRGDLQVVDSRSAEVEELQNLLTQSKDKIISLLMEQSKDKARIAKLETELKFMPDLQSQADRALALVDGAGNLHEELVKLRAQLNNAHLERMRGKLHGHRHRSWWSNVGKRFLNQLHR